MLIKRPQRRPMMVTILLRKAEPSAASPAPHTVAALSVAGERHEAGRCPKQSCPKQGDARSREMPLQPAQPGTDVLQALRAASPILSLLGYHTSKTDDETKTACMHCPQIQLPLT